MFKRTILGALTLCLSIAATNVVAQDHTKVLKKDVGVWDAKLKMTMEGMEMEMAGVETNRMVGGNWVIGSFKGDFGGQAFEGHSTIGYDAAKGKYIGTWVDSMSASMTTMEGSLDEKTGNLVFMVDSIDPASGEKVKGKQIYEYKGDDTRVMKMQKQDGDEWVTEMTITYTRRKGGEKKQESKPGR